MKSSDGRILAVGSNPALQAFDTPFTCVLHPLANRSLANTQSVGYLLLGEALPFEFPGPESAAFTPVTR
jgi:hypothetical protein